MTKLMGGERHALEFAGCLASQATAEVSAVDGTVTITPLIVAGVATQTEIAISSGTKGFATAVVVG